MYVENTIVIIFLSLSMIIFFNLYGENKININSINDELKTKNTPLFNLSSPLWVCPINSFKETNYKSQFNEDKYIINYFIKNKINPFNRIFLEVGAFNGYDSSNTYALEQGYGWRGLLIEGSPSNFKKLEKIVRPRSVKLNYAICNDEGIVEYIDNAGGLGGIKKFKNNNYGDRNVKVKCVPVKKIIKENGLKYIDVFSLDVEGSEESVLKSFDFNLPVRIWIIELNALKLKGNDIEKKKCENVIKMLRNHGYEYMGVSSPKSVNDIYYDPNFDEKIKKIREEEEYIYKIKKCNISYIE